MIHAARAAEHRAHSALELTSFHGRTEETSAIASLLGHARLVTIVGPGGVGKSRLALRVADTVVERFADGLHVIDMADLSAAGADFPELPTYGHDGPVLVLLDNCEHSAAYCADLAQRILEFAPGARILVTSRAPLGVPGERQWRLKPLPVPRPGARVDEIVACEAVQLFVERVARQQPGFRLTNTNAATVAEICRNVDGLPLALELAAEQVALLGLESLSGSDRSAELIRMPSTCGRPLRQATLESSFAWTRALLGERDQALLARLSVFADGFTLESAGAVCGGADADSHHFLDALERLVKTSCVQFEPSASGDRYRVLEIVRHAAASRFSTEERAMLLERLMAWLEALAARLAPWSIDPSEMDVLAAEIGNLRAIFRGTDLTDREQRLRALRLFVGCSTLWVLCFPGEGAEHLARLWSPSHGSGDRVLDARAGSMSGIFAYYAGDAARAITELTPALPILEVHGEDHAVLSARYFLAQAYVQAGDALAAGHLLTDLYQQSRQRGHRLTAGVQACLVHVLLERGDLENARICATQSLREAQVSDHPWNLMCAWQATAAVALRDGDFPAAVEAQVRAVAHAQACRAPHAWVQPTLDLAEMYLTNGDQRAAANVLVGALVRAKDDVWLPAPYLRRVLSVTARVVEPVRPEQAAYFCRAAAHVVPARGWSNSTDVALLCAQARTALQGLLTAQPASHPRTLSGREMEIARLMERGLTNREIGIHLRLSEGTVRTHVGHILDKLDVRSRVQIGSALANQAPSESRQD